MSRFVFGQEHDGAPVINAPSRAVVDQPLPPRVAVTEVGAVPIRQALGVSRVRTEVDAAAFPQGEALPSEKVGYLPREALYHPLEGPATSCRIPTPQLLCSVPDGSLYTRIRALAVALY